MSNVKMKHEHSLKTSLPKSVSNETLEKNSPLHILLHPDSFGEESDGHSLWEQTSYKFNPKFLQDMDMRSRIDHSPYLSADKMALLANNLLGPIKSATSSAIIFNYSPKADGFDRSQGRASSFKENQLQEPSDLMGPMSDTRYGRRSASINAGQATQGGNNENNENNGGNEGKGDNEDNFLPQNYAATLVARVKIKGAFENAAENRVFECSNQELTLINDKAYVIDLKELNRRNNPSSSRKKKKGRLRGILEKHGIISADLIKRHRERNKAVFRAGKNKTLKKSLVFGKNFVREISNRLDKSFKIIREFVSEWIVHSYFHPLGRFRLFWDVISMALIFYDLVNVPFVICFDVDSTDGTMAIDLYKDIYFMIDIILNFKTAYIEDGNIITDPRLIARKYVRRWFFIDLLTSTPIALIVDMIYADESYGASVSVIRLLRFLRFARIARIFKAVKLKKLFVKMEEFFYSSVYSGIKSLISLFFSIILLAHWIACIWHFVGTTVYESSGSSWLSDHGMLELSVGDRYVASLYWAITTMLTVGYGDIIPENTPERVFVIFVMLLGCGVFGYSMNSIGILVQNIQAGVSRTRQMYYNLSKYMDKKHVSKDIRSKVIHYLDYMIETQKHGKMAEDQLLSILSENIRDELKKDVNGKVLRDNALLQKHFGNKFLSLLSNRLEEKIYSPGEIIFDETDRTCSLYFIATGAVEVYYTGCQIALSRIERDGHFGELSFFTGQNRSAASRSAIFSDIFFIQREAFLHLAEEYSIEKETFHTLKDKLMLYNSLNELEIKCPICQGEHVARECHRVHYVPDKEKLTLKHQNERAIFCKNFKRQGLRHFFHAKRDLRELQEKAIRYSEVRSAQIQKLLRNTFNSGNIKLRKKGGKRVKVDSKPNIKESELTLNRDILTLQPLNNQSEKKERKIKFSHGVASSSAIEDQEDQDGSKSHQSIQSSKGSLKEIKSKNRNKKKARFKNSRTEEHREEDEEQEEESEEEESGKRETKSRGRQKKNFTVFQVGSGTDVNGGIFLEVNGMRLDLGNKKLVDMDESKTLTENVVFDMVANYSIYFPHNNVKKILANLNFQRATKRRPSTNEKIESPVVKKPALGIGTKKSPEKRLFGSLVPKVPKAETPTEKGSSSLRKGQSSFFSYQSAARGDNNKSALK